MNTAQRTERHTRLSMDCRPVPGILQVSKLFICITVSQIFNLLYTNIPGMFKYQPKGMEYRKQKSKAVIVNQVKEEQLGIPVSRKTTFLEAPPATNLPKQFRLIIYHQITIKKCTRSILRSQRYRKSFYVSYVCQSVSNLS